MAVVYVTAINSFVGQAADDKPTGIPAGSRFVETDTSKLFLYTGGAWVEQLVDRGGAVTVDGTVTAEVALTSADVVTVTGGAGQTADVKVTLDSESVAVTGTFWQATQPVSGTFWQATQPVSGTVTAQPLDAIKEIALTGVIGVNDQVDQNEYSVDVELALGGTYSGELLAIKLVSSEAGTGAVQTPTVRVLFYDVDPVVAAGDTALALAARQAEIGMATIYSTDWRSDANGGSAYVAVAIPFHAVASLFVVIQNLGTSINDAAGDDEAIAIQAWYRRES